MEKLLFLDFDGVLHPSSGPAEIAFQSADDLAQVLVKHPCKVVISSSWRIHYTLDELKERLPVSMRDLICGTTGDPHFGKWPRFHEIKNYMIERNIITNWRALDDSFIEFPFYCEELIVCNPNTGITNKEMAVLKQWLR